MGYEPQLKLMLEMIQTVPHLTEEQLRGFHRRSVRNAKARHGDNSPMAFYEADRTTWKVFFPEEDFPGIKPLTQAAALDGLHGHLVMTLQSFEEFRVTAGALRGDLEDRIQFLKRENRALADKIKQLEAERRIRSEG